MNTTNLMINQKCNRCGSCLGYGTGFLFSEKDGSIVVDSGVFLEKESQEFNNLQEVCPMEAFEIDNLVDKEKVLAELISALEEHKGVNIPSREDVKFNKDDYFIPIPFASGECQYDYSSDKAADKAALNEFERAMFSQVDSIFLRIIAEYRINKIKPYYVDSIDEGSIYAENNKYVSKLLRGINNALGNQFPSDFSKVNVLPNENYKWKDLNEGECIAEDFIPMAKRYFDYKASSYSYNWKTDGFDKYEGETIFGNSKFKYKCCYMNLNKAFESLADDILRCLGLVDWEIEDRAIDEISCLIEEYNKELNNVIDKKIKLIKKALPSKNSF